MVDAHHVPSEGSPHDRPPDPPASSVTAATADAASSAPSPSGPTASVPSAKPAASAKFPASLDGYTGEGTDLSYSYTKGSDPTDTFTVLTVKAAVDYATYVKALFGGRGAVVGDATCGEVTNSPVKGAITCTLPLAGGVVSVISPGGKTAQQVARFANDLYATFPG